MGVLVWPIATIVLIGILRMLEKQVGYGCVSLANCMYSVFGDLHSMHSVISLQDCNKLPTSALIKEQAICNYQNHQ